MSKILSKVSLILFCQQITRDDTVFLSRSVLIPITEDTRSVDDNVGAPLVGAHENISRVEPNENHQGTHKGCPYMNH